MAHLDRGCQRVRSSGIRPQGGKCPRWPGCQVPEYISPGRRTWLKNEMGNYYSEFLGVNDGETADGNTVHAVFARDAELVVAKVLGLSVGHPDNRRSEYPALPGWVFFECANVVSADYLPGEYPYEGHAWQVPVVCWSDPAWGGDGGIAFSAYWRWPQGACAHCGGEIVHGYCQQCGAQ